MDSSGEEDLLNTLGGTFPMLDDVGVDMIDFGTPQVVSDQIDNFNEGLQNIEEPGPKPRVTKDDLKFSPVPLFECAWCVRDSGAQMQAFKSTS